MGKELFLNATILITFVTIWDYMFKNDLGSLITLKLKLLFGIENGILGCVLILYSVAISNGLIVDFRNIAIIISAIYGGPISTAVTVMIIGSFRILYFGISASSIIGFFAVFTMGAACVLAATRIKSIMQRWIYLIFICIIIESVIIFQCNDDKLLAVKLISEFCIGNIILAIILYNHIKDMIISNELFKKCKMESSKDYLTNLNNVRQFDRVFNDLATRVTEKQELLSLLFIDIDFFKRVNDIYGHLEGDAILKELSEVIMNSCRGVDIVSRNGGEEFSVILQDCPLEQALIIAERTRVNVEKHKFTLSNGDKINITISIGVANYPHTTESITQLIKDADTALYEAKYAGRNRVIQANCETCE
ncbi:MAG: diguanylate cyclase [Solirubrobacterales bacterium]